MSGTSLDGISAALVQFTESDGRVHAELLGWDVFPYDTVQRERLGRGLTGASPEEYCRLQVDLAHWFSDAALQLIAGAGVPRTEIVIASHGQTIWHVPEHSTWQIGEAAVIAERTRCPVVCNFRAADVAAGGQGAPLVAIADALLFSHPTHFRALQNIGGIGNVSIVPPGGDASVVRAFDTGPGGVVIDGVVRALYPGALVDQDGSLSAQGTVIPGVVERLLEDAYFRQEPPKSTGRELFSSAYVAEFIKQCRSMNPAASPADIVATAVRLTSASIADALHRFVAEPVEDLIVAGGGSRNRTLMADLAAQLEPVQVRSFDECFFDAEAKEAVAFALLGWLHHQGRTGNVPSATGARGRRVLGAWTPAPPAVT
jgi:anhydro-N-acetylmuramic acid kinase